MGKTTRSDVAEHHHISPRLHLCQQAAALPYAANLGATHTNPTLLPAAHSSTHPRNEAVKLALDTTIGGAAARRELRPRLVSQLGQDGGVAVQLTGGGWAGANVSGERQSAWHEAAAASTCMERHPHTLLQGWPQHATHRQHSSTSPEGGQRLLRLPLALVHCLAGARALPTHCIRPRTLTPRLRLPLLPLLAVRLPTTGSTLEPPRAALPLPLQRRFCRPEGGQRAGLLGACTGCLCIRRQAGQDMVAVQLQGQQGRSKKRVVGGGGV